MANRCVCCTSQAPCCGEFMVSRERILRHSKEQYQLLLDRLVALKPVRKWQKNKKKADGFRAAYVLEQAWCAPNVSSPSESATLCRPHSARQVHGLILVCDVFLCEKIECEFPKGTRVAWLSSQPRCERKGRQD